MNHSSSRFGWSTWALLFVGVLGCETPPHEVVPVRGELQIAGHSPERISLVFVPETGSKTPEWRAHGVTDERGSFELKCEDGRPGAVPGRYRVMLDDLKVYENPRDNAPPSQRTESFHVSRIPPTYRSVGTTPLVVDVGQERKKLVLRVDR